MGPSAASVPGGPGTPRKSLVTARLRRTHVRLGVPPFAFLASGPISTESARLQILDLFGEIDYDPDYDYKEQRRRDGVIKPVRW